jgi:hypothetical protein
VSKSSVDAKGDRTTHRVNSPNGRPVPSEEFSERVLKTGPSGKVTERIRKTFDDYGRLVGTERTLIEETKGSGNDLTVKETVFHSDLNAGEVETDRRSTEIRARNGEITTTVISQKPGVNRSFSVDERRTTVATGPADNKRIVEVVERPTPAGGFTVSARRETDIVQRGNETKTTTKEFQAKTGTGETLSKQTISTTTRQADGSDVTETSLFVPVGSGKVQSSGDPLQLQEQQILEKRVAADGSTTEVLSVRQPSSIGSGRLNSARVVSETVCTGECVSAPAAAEPKPVAAVKPAAESK